MATPDRALVRWCLIATAAGASAALSPPMSAMAMTGPGMMGGMVDSPPGPMDSMMGSMRALMSWMNGADLDGTPSSPEPPIEPALLAVGQRSYSAHCAACHGEKGDGKGLQAGRLSPRPRDFTTGVYELRSTPTGSLPTDQDLFETISRGIHGTAMVPWIALPEHERWALVAWLESFSKRFAEEPPGPAVVVPSAPPETPALVERGRVLYQRMSCASCHGISGRGDGPSAATLQDQAGRPAHPTDLTQGRFERGSGMADIFLTLRTGMDGSPMPAWGTALSPDETWALAAYVRRLLSRPQPGPAMGCPMMTGSADRQEQAGMMIDMPGMPMGGMRMNP